MPDAPVALVAPPSWYYAALPADLSHAAGALHAAGVDVAIHDLSAALQRDLLGREPGWQALREPAAYLDPGRGQEAARSLFEASAVVSQRFRVRMSPRGLSFPDATGDHLPTALRVGTDPNRNPALPTLWRAVEAILADRSSLVAIALAHPEQRVGGPVLARLLRESGFTGKIVLFGALEDVVGPIDLAPDLVGDHRLWDDVDAVIVGEAESALVALATGAEAPNLLRRGDPALPPLFQEDLARLPAPDFSGFDPELYPYPTPLVDLRVGRGCPWGRCAFCAIQAHQPGWRADAEPRTAQAMQAAHAALGSRWFRIRDDLLTPVQLDRLGRATAELGFTPHWSARARFSPQLTREVLATAAAGGLEELWLGLESASSRVRERMDKGVRDDVVERVLTDCAAVGIRVRALCLLGFPGETADEADQTVAFLEANAHRLASAALTPFQLMRRSPMALHPADHGLELVDDPLPRSERLRFTAEAHLPSALPADVVAGIVKDASTRLASTFDDPWGPTLAHSWMRAKWDGA